MPPSSIWISAGEISGDLHGAALLQALRRNSSGLPQALRRNEPALRLMGMGGPAMRSVDGFESFFRVEQLSVMGFTEVIGQLPKILRLLGDIEKKMKQERPQAVVVIDAPDFHFRLIKAARRLNIPVYYYISPKIWAWRQGRAEFIRKHVRRLISILPFEVDFYRRFGMEVDYVGNPLLDALDLPALDQIAPQPGRIGFLPGSRRREVSALMPEFGLAAQALLAARPDLKFCCARAPGLGEDFLRSFWPQNLPLELFEPEERYPAMRACEMLIAASGTVTLETALMGIPTLIAYKMSSLSFGLAKRIIKVPFVGLPNLIAGREIFPELLQGEADGAKLARKALEWLSPRPGGRGLPEVRADLAELRKQVGTAGATDRAAALILADLASTCPN
ncbi:MAG: lipid-A-disaccharide synthase [Deltaproteobacteria bacterium]|jgi:lipid-A-disaccharide synthase|nr:lipid-A-disaccharide synthase [Deltaproteobacteria bacterium]